MVMFTLILYQGILNFKKDIVHDNGYFPQISKYSGGLTYMY